MESSVDSIQEFSHTQQTTLKSEIARLLHHYISLTTNNIRILIASIRNLGKCPCPRCLIPLSLVHNLGMARDMGQRETMVRVDNIQRRSNVYAARRVIYEMNFLVNSAGVENILRGTSLVPTEVSCVHSFISDNILILKYRTPFPTGCFLLPSIYSRCCSQI
jgi:hypothetical protein